MNKWIVFTLLALCGCLFFIKLKQPIKTTDNSTQDAISPKADAPTPPINSVTSSRSGSTNNEVTITKVIEQDSPHSQSPSIPSSLFKGTEEMVPTYSKISYDPANIDLPGYKAKVMRHLRLKQLYLSPLKDSKPFHQCLDLALELSSEPDQLRIDAMHLHRMAREYDVYVRKRKLRQSELPEHAEKEKELDLFSIRDRFEFTFPEASKEDWERLIQIEPEGTIPYPIRSIEIGEKLISD